MAGRLGQHVTAWQDLTGDRWVLDTVTGYRLDLGSLPPPVRTISIIPLEQDISSLFNIEVEVMLKKGAIKKIFPSAVYNLSPFFAVRKPGKNKIRLILDLRSLNCFVTYHSLQDGRAGHCERPSAAERFLSERRSLQMLTSMCQFIQHTGSTSNSSGRDGLTNSDTYHLD